MDDVARVEIEAGWYSLSDASWNQVEQRKRELQRQKHQVADLPDEMRDVNHGRESPAGH